MDSLFGKVKLKRCHLVRHISNKLLLWITHIYQYLVQLVIQQQNRNYYLSMF